MGRSVRVEGFDSSDAHAFADFRVAERGALCAIAGRRDENDARTRLLRGERERVRAACVGKPVTERALACARSATRVEAVEACFR